MSVLKKIRLYYPCIETSQVELLPDQMCRDSGGKSIKRTVLYDIEQTEGTETNAPLQQLNLRNNKYEKGNDTKIQYGKANT